jgi:hypothetical protein
VAEPDYRTPSPDLGHEAIRKPLADAIDQLHEQGVGIDDSYYLVDLLFSLLDNVIDGARAKAQQVADLEARVAALEPAVFTPDVPTP